VQKNAKNVHTKEKKFKRAEEKINKWKRRHASTDLILIKRILNFCIYDLFGYATGKRSIYHNEYSLSFGSKYAV
jgi:hypothetical protein